MRTKLQICLLMIVAVATNAAAQQRRVFEGTRIVLPSAKLRFTRALRISRFFYETDQGRIFLPKQFGAPGRGVVSRGWTAQMPDGHTITVSIDRDQNDYRISLKAQPDTDILKWGISIDSTPAE